MSSETQALPSDGAAPEVQAPVVETASAAPEVQPSVVEAASAPTQGGSEDQGGRRESGRARQRRQKKAEATDSPLYQLKVEGAHALGLWEKIQAVGWGGLSAAESGRVGGYITRVRRMQREESQVGG